MAFQGIREYIELLEQKGELIRIKQYVNPVLEIPEIVDRVSKSPEGGKALLFENTGTDFPVLINAFGSNNRMALALGADNLNAIGDEIESLFKKLVSPKAGLMEKLRMLPMLGQISSWMPKSVSGKGKCQEVIMKEPDMGKLPVLTCWPADGGPFVTLPCVVTRDPETGVRNVGMYRMQVFGPNLTGMHWHKHKTGARHFNEYKKRGERMPISVVLGGDPAYTYAATAPLPDNIDEYLLAGFLRKKRVELVKCITNDLEVPSNADFVIEGYVDPEEDFVWEGPFGDHTGFYSLADWYPKFHVTCITHRKDAVYPATIVGIPPQEDAYIGRATERIFLSPMKLTMIPEMEDMELPPAGVAHNLTISKIDKTFAGQAAKVMNAMWGAGQMMFNKVMIVADGQTDIHNYPEIARMVSQVVDPAHDIYFTQGPMDVLDHSAAKFAYGSKMGIDATHKYEEELYRESANYTVPASSVISADDIKKEIPEVHDINADLLDLGISFVVVSVNKNQPGMVKTLGKKLAESEAFKGVKFIAIVDEELDIRDMNAVGWYVSGNIDPKRDSQIFDGESEGEVSHLVLDGTRKSGSLDNFKRDWPNPVVSSMETIRKVDEMWPKLGLGEFIESPSLRYIPIQKGTGAIAGEE
ncbi:menaquinone biosynthesis decarboxylase [Prolixibacter bellariivorans]|uniref:Menaquinone biosynthesis decarboxylase n=1 Tax=Prolixibacter bellariivorans TaxID=314319 RepID=A0A5M4AWJ3_9BACT|nr:menaquinone biosynthesis decarboxylase [Prolixibacter bellariivorans]GET32023.1 menaquinone biosynthesis decarboxylase [Prolixibacter bellariivorans]